MTTESMTIMLLPSQRIGRVRLIPSKRSCASFPTALFFRLAASFNRATAASALAISAVVGTLPRAGVVLGGVAKPLGAAGAEMRVKFWMEEMGRTWWVGGVLGEVETAIATRLVIGHAVKSGPSIMGCAGRVV